MKGTAIQETIVIPRMDRASFGAVATPNTSLSKNLGVSWVYWDGVVEVEELVVEEINSAVPVETWQYTVRLPLFYSKSKCLQSL
ncbi:10942_t:CDS:2 [Acaulospora colombiana]|uniref:10942_t:CDS:1 n=1 Tax=Acaulospora colombiana TaxID=27376 RepID=A0ACA9PE59_9GLOM|nr:10942_t:CDS:2 [Acaulospora colombiana]